MSAFDNPSVQASTMAAAASAWPGAAAICLKLSSGILRRRVPWRATARNPDPTPYRLRSNPNIACPGSTPRKCVRDPTGLALVERDGEDHHAALDHVPHRGRVVEQKRTMRADVDDRASLFEPAGAGRRARRHRDDDRAGEVQIADRCRRLGTRAAAAGGPCAATRDGGGVVTGAGPFTGDGATGGWGAFGVNRNWVTSRSSTCACGAGMAAGIAEATHSISTRPPSRNRSPGLRMAVRSIFLLATQVPYELPRSVRTTPSGVISSRAWARDTSCSAKTRSHSSARPSVDDGPKRELGARHDACTALDHPEHDGVHSWRLSRGDRRHRNRQEHRLRVVVGRRGVR